MDILETLKTLGLTAIIVVSIYLAIFLSYILIPASVFLFVFYVLRTMHLEEK